MVEMDVYITKWAEIQVVLMEVLEEEEGEVEEQVVVSEIMLAVMGLEVQQ